MFRPPAFDLESRVEILDVLQRTVFGHLVTNGPGGLASTALPFVIDDELSCVRAHFARANPHWRELDGSDALMIVPGTDGYISPRWYPSKAEHGKVVPTWNYELVHLHGTISIHDDAEWKLRLVSDLTDHNERHVDDPTLREKWGVSDAPSEFIDKQLKAIVGVQLTISTVEAKRKLSQNKTDADRDGVIDGLNRSSGHRDADLAASMSSETR
jgi:transcriptional regulator